MTYLSLLLSPFLLDLMEVIEIDWAGLTWGNAIAFFLGVELSALNHLLLDGMLIPLPVQVKRVLKGN